MIIRKLKTRQIQNIVSANVSRHPSVLIYSVKRAASLSKFPRSTHYIHAGTGFLRGMPIRNPHPTMRRDFGDRSWALMLAKKNIRRAINARPPDYRSPAMRDVIDTCEIVEHVQTQSEHTMLAAPQGGAERHEARWHPRSTLFLIVSVGALFWGAVFWLILG